MVGAIVPWNAPVLLAAVKIAPALCAGNTMVMKAAEDAPLAVLLLAEVCSEHLPAGRAQRADGIRRGVRRARSRITRWSGSSRSPARPRSGKLVMRAAADRIVPVSLELGGKSPSIVFPDATRRDRGRQSSPRCGSRARASRAPRDRGCSSIGRSSTLPREAGAQPRALKIGDPLDEATDIGAIINEKQFGRYAGTSKTGSASPGARWCWAASRPTGPAGPGLLRVPTLFADVSTTGGSRARRSSVPCSWRSRWDDGTDAIRMANDTPLRARRVRLDPRPPRGLRTAHAIEAGWVQVNQGLGQCPGIRTAGSSRAASGASSRSRACSTGSLSGRT